MTVTYSIRPQGARFSAQMNAAAKRTDLAFDSERRCWITTSADAIAAMRRLGAEVVEVSA